VINYYSKKLINILQQIIKSMTKMSSLNMNNFFNQFKEIFEQKDREIKQLKALLSQKDEKDREIERLRSLLDEKDESPEEDFSPYTKIKANGHTLTVYGQRASIPGQLVCTGQYTVPANTVKFDRVLNLADFFFPSNGQHIFTNKYGNRSTNIFDRVQNFMVKHIDVVRETDYFIAAINKNKKGGKTDLPNVNAAVVLWLLRHHERDVIFMDPLDFIKNPMLATTTTPVKLSNLSVVVRWIDQKIKYDVPIDSNADRKNGEIFVNYQRGRGVPSSRERQAILDYVGDNNASILHIKLTPGKYDYNGSTYGVPKLCYSEFNSSVAQVVNQFTDFNEYLRFKNKTSMKRMYLVMDEFSGYSMYTIAALVGFGFDKITSVLCYFRGDYSSFNLHS